MTFVLVMGANKEEVFDSFGGEVVAVVAHGGLSAVDTEEVVVQCGVSCP